MVQVAPERVKKIIAMGTLYQPSDEPIISDKHLDEMIAVLIACSKEDPGVLLTELYTNSSSHVAMVGLAVLSSAGPQDFLIDRNVRTAAIDILLQKNPIQILEFVEYIRSRTFGRGFGSRPQKWVRKVMEGWKKEELEKYLSSCPDEMHDLIKLIHPRYHGERGVIVSNFLKRVRD